MICNVMKKFNFIDIYFTGKKDIEKFIFKEEIFKKNSEPEISDLPFNKPSTKPKKTV